MVDPISGAPVMKEVITDRGPDRQSRRSGGVDEWCINSAAVDPINKCAVVNSEDGHVYRWSFVNNTLSSGLDLAPATGEAYTSTAIGPDGAVYAINDAKLFCCDYDPRRGHSSSVPPANFGLDRPRTIEIPSVHGVFWMGILAALSLQTAIWVSRRFRNESGSFLSRMGRDSVEPQRFGRLIHRVLIQAHVRALLPPAGHAARYWWDRATSPSASIGSIHPAIASSSSG